MNNICSITKKGGQMVKRINISVSDELSQKINSTKKKSTNFNTSKICTEALMEKITEMDAHQVYKMSGFNDGQKHFSKLDEGTLRIIERGMSIKDKTLDEKVSSLEFRLALKTQKFLSKFKKLMDGKQILHEWVQHSNWLTAEDRRSEMSRSYVEGWYEGVFDSYSKKDN